uniref:Proteasome activator PA28 C-terminal domain-containing protein n=1 Tax=Cebus imitator TaxID=2715852 RepID=A0A2K5QBS9_CEBIM
MASLLKVDQEVKLKVDSFREWITREADLVAKLDECEEAFQGTKAFVMPNGMLKSNQQLVHIIEKKCNTVKMWVQLLIPRIEDGNNFGVSIQEETVTELRTVETKLVSKIAKYPHVQDYHHTMTEIDEKEYIGLWLIISELRNQYVTVHDTILKNIEKINGP